VVKGCKKWGNEGDGELGTKEKYRGECEVKGPRTWPEWKGRPCLTLLVLVMTIKLKEGRDGVGKGG